MNPREPGRIQAYFFMVATFFKTPALFRSLQAMAAAVFVPLCIASTVGAVPAFAAPIGPAAPVVPRPILPAAVRNTNILIVPFDELSRAQVGNVAVPVVPIVPPAAPGVAAKVEARVAAQKRPAPQDEFAPVPEPGGLVAPRNNAPRNDAPIQPAFGAAPPTVMVPRTAPPRVPASSGALDEQPAAGMAPSSSPAPGFAQNAAAPLRRVLVRAGFADVLSSPLDGTSVRRVVNERRLSARTLQAVRNGMKQLVAVGMDGPAADAADAEKVWDGPAPPVAMATIQATRAATRLGNALGYRAVVLMAVLPSTNGASAATYVMLVADAARGTSETLAFDETGASWSAAHEAAASSGSALLLKKLMLWPDATAQQKAQAAADYFQQARALASTDKNEAIDLMNQSLALDPGQGDVYVVMGDLVNSSDPTAAARFYQRALETGTLDAGTAWEKIAVAQAGAKDWPRALEAARQALILRHDTAALRSAMATAQFGRGALFRRADHLEEAEAAEAQGRVHLDKAREMAPDDPQIARLLAEQYVAQRRFSEAVELLDDLVSRGVPDASLQGFYAATLTDRGGREIDAFIAWARLWKMKGTKSAAMPAARYRRIADGFDRYVTALAHQASQQVAGVAGGTVARENALLQLQGFSDSMVGAKGAITILHPPKTGTLSAAQEIRVFAVDLLDQALDAYRVYAETGDDIYRGRGTELHRQAINQLNVARGGRAQ